MRSIDGVCFAVLLLGASSCSAGLTSGTAQLADAGVVATTSAQPTSPLSALRVFESDLEWRKNVEATIPMIDSWADDQVVPIAKAFCHDFDNKPRITKSVIDGALEVLMDGPAKMNRDDAWSFLTLTVVQFCPTYVENLDEY